MFDFLENLAAPGLEPQFPLYALLDALVEELVGFNFNRGVLACGWRIAVPKLAERGGKNANH